MSPNLPNLRTPRPLSLTKQDCTYNQPAESRLRLVIANSVCRADVLISSPSKVSAASYLGHTGWQMGWRDARPPLRDSAATCVLRHEVSPHELGAMLRHRLPGPFKPYWAAIRFSTCSSFLSVSP